MFLRFSLAPKVWHQQPIEFEWDAVAGVFRGRDAKKVVSLCDDARRSGWVSGDPVPTSYPVTDPHRNIADLAVVLDAWWVLDDTLAAARPQPAPVADEEGDYQVLY